MTRNKCQLIGNVGKHAELKDTQAGPKRLAVRIATSESWEDEMGERHKRTQRQTVVFWGKRAEAAAPHMRRGAQVLVEGSYLSRIIEVENTRRDIWELRGHVAGPVGPGDRWRHLGAASRRQQQRVAARPEPRRGPPRAGQPEPTPERKPKTAEIPDLERQSPPLLAHRLPERRRRRSVMDIILPRPQWSMKHFDTTAAKPLAVSGRRWPCTT